MKKRPRNAPIRTEILSVNLLVIGVSLVLALGSTLGLTLRQSYRALDGNLMNSALVISRVPLVAETLASGGPGEALSDFLDASTARVGDIDVIVVADSAGIQYYYPDRAYIGKPYAGGDQKRILAGEAAFTSNDTGVSGAERCAYAEVRSPSGELLGFVMVGINLRSVKALVTHTLLQYLAIAAVVALLGVLLSAKLSARIKGRLLGYEPDAFLKLFHQREEILEALEEGILAIDGACSVMYYNRAAAELLHIPPDAAGRPLREVYPKSTLGRVLESGKAEYNVSLRSLRDVRVISDRMPVFEQGELIGAVAIFRNRTEVTRLAEDLTGVRHIVEAMRAYTHEFMNKLHVILGLIQLGESEKAEAFIMDTSAVQREGISRIMRRIEDQSAAALLVGKTARAAELGIRLKLDPDSRLSGGELYLPSSAYVTILGNLIENAFDALNQSAQGARGVTVGIREDAGGLLICVEDTGPGMRPDLADDIFRKGFSTKQGERGTGLFLVREVVDAYRGEIRVESEPGVGTSFFVTFRTAMAPEREGE